MTNLDRYKSDLQKLVQLGEKMELDVTLRHRQKSEGKPDQKLKDSAEKLKAHSKMSTSGGSQNLPQSSASYFLIALVNLSIYTKGIVNVG
jgi:hypothetical protein